MYPQNPCFCITRPDLCGATGSVAPQQRWHELGEPVAEMPGPTPHPEVLHSLDRGPASLAYQPFIASLLTSPQATSC